MFVLPDEGKFLAQSFPEPVGKSAHSENVDDIPKDCVDEIVLVDDLSSDDTVEIAKKLPLTLIQHEKNRGYGGNQKTCYQAALERGADYVVMLHADYQYDARMIRPVVDILRLGNCDVILGNRIRTRGEALQAGMPFDGNPAEMLCRISSADSPFFRLIPTSAVPWGAPSKFTP